MLIAKGLIYQRPWRVSESYLSASAASVHVVLVRLTIQEGGWSWE